MKIGTVLFINLLIGHLLADFPCQKDSWVQDKQERKLRGWGIWKHFIVVLSTSIIALGNIDFVYLSIAFGITVIHIGIDYSKVRFTKNGPCAFVVDQIMHIIVLAVATYFITRYCDWHQWRIVPKGKELLYPLIICAYLFCLSPANYIIREILKYCHVTTVSKKNSSEENENIRVSGVLIGSLERFLVLTFILIGNFEAAGLTVAAKSLLRFNDDEGPRTEYVLVGTLLSIIVAVVCALVIFKVGMGVSVLKNP